jgi:hypothetical protein
VFVFILAGTLLAARSVEQPTMAFDAVKRGHALVLLWGDGVDA